MMHRFLFLLLFSGMLLFASCGSDSHGLPFFQTVSGITLPEGTETIQQTGDGKQISVAVVKIPVAKCAAFVQQHHLLRLDSLGHYVTRSFYGNYMLEKDNRAPEFTTDILVSEGCNKHQHWTYYLRLSDGMMWCLVEYPANDGTFPC